MRQGLTRQERHRLNLAIDQLAQVRMLGGWGALIEWHEAQVSKVRDELGLPHEPVIARVLPPIVPRKRRTTPPRPPSSWHATNPRKEHDADQAIRDALARPVDAGVIRNRQDATVRALESAITADGQPS